jgi:signal recognition particle GTPase
MAKSKYHKMTKGQLSKLSPSQREEARKSINTRSMDDSDMRLADHLKDLFGGGVEDKKGPVGKRTKKYSIGGVDGVLKPKKKAKYKKGTSRTPTDETPEGRKERVEKLRKKYEQVGKKTERPLEDIGDDEIKENIDLQIASSYLHMLAEQDYNNLVEEVLNEMQNILESSFDEEEYKTIYEYVSDVLKEYADPKEQERDGKPGNSHSSSRGQKTKPGSVKPNSSDKEARIRAHMNRVAAKK